MAQKPIRIDILPNYAFTAKGYYKQLPDGYMAKGLGQIGRRGTQRSVDST